MQSRMLNQTPNQTVFQNCGPLPCMYEITKNNSSLPALQHPYTRRIMKFKSNVGGKLQELDRNRFISRTYVLLQGRQRV